MHRMLRDILQDVRKSSLELGLGGPFGAVVYKGGEIVGKGVNRVIVSNDPTAHAEIVAIRAACKNLQAYDLAGCVLYATGYPCPMCMAAIIWANIRKVYYSCDYRDAEILGFRDRRIFNFLTGGCADAEVLDLEQIDKTEVLRLYKDFAANNGRIY